MCPHDCKWEVEGELFTSAKQDFQYEKLMSHDKRDEAESLLQIDSTLEIKRLTKSALAEEEVSEYWTQCEQDKMLQVCRRKFDACEHARDCLLNSKSELAEATLDKKWGTGMDMANTIDCTPDFWPGQNLMGQILKQVHSELLEQRCLALVEQTKEEDSQKRKDISPLIKAAKKFGFAK